MLATALLLTAGFTSIQGNGIRLDMDAQMRTRVVATAAVATPLGPFADSETLLTVDGELQGFRFEARTEADITDALGSGHSVSLTGRSGAIVKRVEVTAYPAHPHWLLLRVRYTNEGSSPLRVRGYISDRYELEPQAGGREPAFWSYQSASYENRPDWLLPVPPGYARGNFLGMNADDYGGGTPVLDVWRRDVGVAIGHVELMPKLAALPLQRAGAGNARFGLSVQRDFELAPGAGFDTLRSFVSVHHGDHFATLRAYSGIMQAQGLKLNVAPADAFEPSWCAWGYGREFTPEQVIDSLPIVRQLGFRWAVLDDGWQVAEGDWTPNRAKFPAGDADMKAMVARIHAAGMKAQLWWAPLAADPGSRTDREHHDWLLQNADGTPRHISWWDANYLCPAYGPVQDDAAAFVRKALGEWGFDGLKIDGQHLNAAPPCFNKSHHHAEPEEAAEHLPDFFKAIWNATQQTRPGAVVEICPCGTGYSFFTMPYLNMTVASDPESSWQVRLKGKTIKALLGDRNAYLGDFVELSEGGTDFASTFGVGGIIGTQFAWPGAPGKKDPKLLLTPERAALWAKWTRLFQRLRLVDGEYLGTLYDIGFDVPETHVIAKGGAMYYAFYAKRYHGTIELRGLAPGRYRVRDYVHDRDLGAVRAPAATLDADFKHSLLIEVRPADR
ncbi:MAG: alpha-galactosidase [Gammaproteobacteria bacterium]|nr:alpha-galactosidase [Gammaproteobacteria bacterium]